MFHVGSLHSLLKQAGQASPGHWRIAGSGRGGRVLLPGFGAGAGGAMRDPTAGGAVGPEVC